MYEFISRISAWLSQPLTGLAYSSDIAMLAALFLGVLGSVAPCQISANIGSITYFSNRHVQQRLSWLELPFYLSGKMLVYSLFGLLFWMFGQKISNETIPFFVYARKLIGPLLLVIGLFLMGWLRLPGNIGFRLSNWLNQWPERIGGKSGAFLMGVAFSLGFCPTMFWLFFGLLMPLVLQSSTGFLLPPVFAVGTAIPLLLFIGLSIGIGLDRMVVKKAKNWGRRMQIAAGVLFTLLGISDTITYWTL
ncbi:MAG: sulfite exporter TauE/SafE family protein [Thermincola sp.]|jgi:cytochrome c biogenesis protein CcdA|nr:sulfite exporter TauE/SafE family protein [Thermincola sp.]MDT3704775.1 sulfite exporter TauE/SafE family protein [Thermincola sp.]